MNRTPAGADLSVRRRGPDLEAPLELEAGDHEPARQLTALDAAVGNVPMSTTGTTP